MEKEDTESSKGGELKDQSAKSDLKFDKRKDAKA